MFLTLLSHGVPAALKLFQDLGQWHFLVGFQISKILFSDDFKEYYEQFAYTVGGPVVQKLWGQDLLSECKRKIKSEHFSHKTFTDA